MEIKIESNQVQEILKEKLPEWFREKLSSDYDNPLKDAVDEAIKEKEGEIKKLVAKVLNEILTDEKFGTALREAILSKIIQKGLRE